MARTRPKYLNLLQIRLPLPALVSILHRVSGALLFLLIPLLLWLLQASLESVQTYERLRATVSHPFVKLVLLALLWAYLHHLLAGLRHLALDLHIGVELAPARASSGAVLALGILLTLATGVALW
jgi:succinate dehydrogenase / fumarate reductase cytochrome b subunit